MIKNRKGFTLVELMIVLALLSVVMMVGFSFFSYSFKSFNAQTDNIDNQSKVRYAISDVTKEIRKVNGLNIIISNEMDVDGVVYKLQGSTLSKNGNVLVSGIKLFKPSSVGNKITLEITSQPKHGREFTLISEIYIRE
jgi:prepilin-type N-terminal cleavage/methylation domain-containing protein